MLGFANPVTYVKHPPCCYFREYLDCAMCQVQLTLLQRDRLLFLRYKAFYVRAHAHSLTLEKLRSKDVAMHTGGVSVNYA